MLIVITIYFCESVNVSVIIFYPWYIFDFLNSGVGRLCVVMGARPQFIPLLTRRLHLLKAKGWAVYIALNFHVNIVRFSLF